MECGIFHVVSVGPGDPELMTGKAVRILRQCPVIAAPVTDQGHTVALDIAMKAVACSGKTIHRFSLPMSRGRAECADCYRLAADRIESELRAGRDTAMPVLGDAGIYASAAGLISLIEGDGFEVETVPGVPSFCAAAAEGNLSLCSRDGMLHILTPAHADAGPETMQGSRVIMKAGGNLPMLLETIKSRGLLEKTWVAADCGMPGGQVCPASEWKEKDPGYFTTVIIKE